MVLQAQFLLLSIVIDKIASRLSINRPFAMAKKMDEL